MKHIGWRLAALLLCMAMLVSVTTGCALFSVASPAEDGDGTETDGPEAGGDATDTETGDDKKTLSVKDFDPEKTYDIVDYFALDMTEYVQLGRYERLTLTVEDAAWAVSDAALQSEVDALLQAHHPGAKITDRAVQKGDAVVIDYVGKIDGEAFSGGTAYEQTVTADSGTGYIEGFAEGLIGLTPGETADVAVTFPDDYGKPNYAGKDAVFTMTVHYIVGNPTLDDAFVRDFTEGEMTSAEEYLTAMRTEMEQEAYDAACRNALWSKIMENALILEYPADAVMYYYDYYYVLYSQYAQMYGTTYDKFLSMAGMSADSIFEYCKSMVKQDLVRHAVYVAGNFSCTDEQYEQTLTEYTEANYPSLRASMIASGEKEYTEAQAREYFHENYYSQLKDTCLDGIATKALLAGATVNGESGS